MRNTRTRLPVVLLAGLSLFAFGLLAGCGDEDDPETLSTCVTTGPVIDIQDNHRTSGGDHKLTIPAADVSAGTTMEYDIRGDNTGHTHTVTVSDQDFALLQAGTPVNIVSSDNGSAGMSHTHTVAISCP